MTKILIRSGKSPETALSPEASLAASRFAVFGTNSGNLLFSSSVTRMLSVPGTEVVSDSLLTERAESPRAHVDRVNREFDAFVVPLANAFRPQFVGVLRRLTRFIEQLTIPVVVVGVGAQLPVDGDLSAGSAEVREAAKAFASAVLDRSATIGVRGDITRRFLLDVGVPDGSIDVIGCPSIFDAGPGLRIEKKVDAITPDSPIAFNTAITNPGAGDFVDWMTRNHPNGVYIGQSIVELSLLLWGTPIPKAQPGLAADLDHPLITEDRMRFFVDPSTWIDFLGRRDFSIGARIHGNVAALLGGTPAVVLAADSRTLELADHHAIPYRITPRLSGDVDVAGIHDAIDFTEFNRRVPENFAGYTAFLERNGLQHVGGAEGGAAAFDARLAAAPLPGPVGSPLAPDGVRQLLSRVAWLRQGAEADDRRKAGAYVPPIVPVPVVDPVERLAQRVAALEKAQRGPASGLGSRVRRPLGRVRRRVRSVVASRLKRD